MGNSRNKLVSAFLRGTSVGIVLVGEGGRVVLANEDAEKLFGAGRRELIGHLLEEMLPGYARQPGTASSAVPGSAGIAEIAGSRRVLVGRRLDGSHLAVEAQFRTVVHDSTRLIVATIQRERALDERERIAGVLNDTVVRRLLALGITLTADTMYREREEVIARVRASVDEVDRIGRLIRDAVFPRSSVDEACMSAGPRPELEAATLEEAPRSAYLAFFEHNADGVLFTAADGSVLAANPAACQMLGMSEEEIRRAGFEGLADPLEVGWVAAVEEGARTGSIRGDLRLRRRDGSSFPVEITSNVFHPDGQETISRTCIVFRDVSERGRVHTGVLETMERLRVLAVSDELTGLYNRRGFMTIGAHELRGALRTGRPAALLLLDVDGLKQLNDGLGHQAGDEALMQVASALRAVCRNSDVIGRVGGDEFYVLLVDTADEGARQLEARLRAAALGLMVRGHSVTLSVGVALFQPESPVDLEELMSRADAEMYQHKFAAKAVPAQRRAAFDGAEDGFVPALTSGNGQAVAEHEPAGALTLPAVAQVDRSVGSDGSRDEPTLPGRAMGRDWIADSPVSDGLGPEPAVFAVSSTSDTASTGELGSRGARGAASYSISPRRGRVRGRRRNQPTESRAPRDLDAVCSVCGFSAASLTPAGLIGAIVAVPDRYRDLLATFGALEEIDAVLRWRSVPPGWSALERIAHVADSLHASAKCVVSMIEGDRSRFAPVHVDAPRAESQAWPSRVVLASLTAAVTDLARVASRADCQASQRLIQLADHQVSARDLLDDALHEAHHHLADVEHLLANAASAQNRARTRSDDGLR